MKKKICFVVQRYGLEVNGGAELLCRQLAEQMVPYCDQVDVLTTKAIDYISWKDEYKADVEEINGVTVRRFSVDKPRVIDEFNKINGEFLTVGLPREREMEWIEKQGPVSSKLINYIKKNKDVYDVFLFSTYLYYPTVVGVKEVAEKAIVMPNAHDEPFLRMKIFDEVFQTPKAFLFNTDEERKFVHEKYDNSSIRFEIGGAGVVLPEAVNPNWLKDERGLDNYIIYVGRIDEGKQCHVLFEHFIRYKRRNPGDLKLVLVGKPVIPVPNHPDIVSLGFVSEQEKFDAIAGAKILVLPSEFESLSIVVLEAMSSRTLVLVNGKCPVLKGHCTKSNGALYYLNFEEFEGCVNYLLTHEEETNIMKDNAVQYVEENYKWDVITRKLCALVDDVSTLK